MPSTSPKTVMLHGKAVAAGSTIELGTMSNSEEEIIAFARFVDPLPLHLDMEKAKASIFGGLVASGAMLYIESHKRWFVPMFGDTVVCGLGIRDWRFMRPHYPGVSYRATITAKSLEVNKEKGTVEIEWHYAFHDRDGVLVQELNLGVIHRTDQ